MNFNKCNRCGCFFMTGSDICPNCAPKEQLEINHLKNYIEENINNALNIDDIVSSTGISAKNLNRFFKQEAFSSFSSQLENNEKIKI